MFFTNNYKHTQNKLNIDSKMVQWIKVLVQIPGSHGEKKEQFLKVL